MSERLEKLNYQWDHFGARATLASKCQELAAEKLEAAKLKLEEAERLVNKLEEQECYFDTMINQYDDWQDEVSYEIDDLEDEGA